MHIDRTKYTAHYENGRVVAEWISVDHSLDESAGEDPMAALNRSKEIVEKWYKSNHPEFPDNSIPPGPPPVIQVKPEDRRIGIMADDIMSCQDLLTLDSYKLLVKGKLELEAAYNTRRAQIIAIETKDILDRTHALTEYGKNK